MQDPEPLTWNSPEFPLPKDQLPWCQRLPGKHIKEGSGQQSCPPMSLINHSKTYMAQYPKGCSSVVHSLAQTNNISIGQILHWFKSDRVPELRVTTGYQLPSLAKKLSSWHLLAKEKVVFSNWVSLSILITLKGGTHTHEVDGQHKITKRYLCRHFVSHCFVCLFILVCLFIVWLLFKEREKMQSCVGGEDLGGLGERERVVRIYYTKSYFQ